MNLVANKLFVTQNGQERMFLGVCAFHSGRANRIMDGSVCTLVCIRFEEYPLLPWPKPCYDRKYGIVL